MEKVDKQQLNDFELENVTGGGRIAAYVIIGVCSYVGTILGSFLHIKMHGQNTTGTVQSNHNHPSTIKASAASASLFAFQLSGFTIGQVIGEEICKKFGIKY